MMLQMMSRVCIMSSLSNLPHTNLSKRISNYFSNCFNNPVNNRVKIVMKQQVHTRQVDTRQVLPH